MDKDAYEIRMKQWASIIQEAGSSGLTKTEWCKEHNISLRNFYYWQRKLRQYVLSHDEVNPSLPAKRTPDKALEGDSAIQPLPVFCELTPPKSEPAKPAGELGFTEPFIPEIALCYGDFHFLIGNTVSEKTLSTVLSVLRHV